MGINGAAFASVNPFIDVPVRHWAYDAVNQLVQAGVIDGYGDNRFNGDRQLTRYELAQITAKAMTRGDKAGADKKILIDKLALEFAAELNNLGVRVAALEKNASPIKFNGDVRIRWQNNADLNALNTNPQMAQSLWDNRLRIAATADINENMKFNGRLSSVWQLGPNVSNTTYNMTWEVANFEYAWSQEKKISIGRHSLFLGQGLIADLDSGGGFDGVRLAYGSGKLSLDYTYGSMASALLPYDASSAVWASALNLSYEASKKWTFTGSALYSHSNDTATITDGSYSNGYPFQVYSVGVTGKISPEITWTSEYAVNTSAVAKNAYPDENLYAWFSRLWYKGAEPDKKGTWGIYADYRDVKPYSIDPALTTLNCGNIANGFKGFGAGFNWTIDQNMVLTGAAEFLSQNRSTPIVANAQYAPYFSIDLTYTF